MSKYVYVDPTDVGFTKVYFTKQEHNELFPSLKRNVIIHYDYYISDNKLILHRVASRLWVTIMTIGFPIVLLIATVSYGLSNLRELYNEYYELYNQKRLGRFLSEEYWSNSDTYAAACNTLANGGQWS